MCATSMPGYGQEGFELANGRNCTRCALSTSCCNLPLVANAPRYMWRSWNAGVLWRQSEMARFVFFLRAHDCRVSLSQTKKKRDGARYATRHTTHGGHTLGYYRGRHFHVWIGAFRVSQQWCVFYLRAVRFIKLTRLCLENIHFCDYFDYSVSSWENAIWLKLSNHFKNNLHISQITTDFEYIVSILNTLYINPLVPWCFSGSLAFWVVVYTCWIRNPVLPTSGSIRESIFTRFPFAYLSFFFPANNS